MAGKRKAENLDKSRLSALFVASSPGLEPGAFRLGGGPSIQLRYWGISSSVILQCVGGFVKKMAYQERTNNRLGLGG